MVREQKTAPVVPLQQGVLQAQVWTKAAVLPAEKEAAAVRVEGR